MLKWKKTLKIKNGEEGIKTDWEEEDEVKTDWWEKR